jgi:spermidine/putrescine transport system substrate-binding protein
MGGPVTHASDDASANAAARAAMSRRRLIQAALLAGPSALALSACARATPASSGAAATTGPSGAGPSAAGLQIASPENPITWPISPGNEPIAEGLEPERDATLRLYNYADYLDPGVIKAFEQKYADYGVKVELSTFNDTLEALAKIRSGSVPFDVYFPSYDSIGKLVLGGLIRPLTHSYIPNIANVYPEFTNPFYDQQWQYTTPYTLYTTGIGWRSDRVTEDIGARPNPYDILWDPQYREHLAVLDDYRAVISMTILRNGGTDVNTDDSAVLDGVQQALSKMNELTQPRVTITGYTDIPEGRLDISQAWSGDLIAAQYYLPKGTDPSILRYWFPKDGRGLVNNDTMVVLKGGQNPVLAHLFLNHVLDTEQAMSNFAFTGYQPPQVSITPESMVTDGLIPENLKDAVVLPGYFATGYRSLELSPATEAKYLAIWQQFKAGA